MTNFKQCNHCATDCEHHGAIRLCECSKYTKPLEVKCPCCGKLIIPKRTAEES